MHVDGGWLGHDWSSKIECIEHNHGSNGEFDTLRVQCLRVCVRCYCRRDASTPTTGSVPARALFSSMSERITLSLSTPEQSRNNPGTSPERVRNDPGTKASKVVPLVGLFKFMLHSVLNLNPIEKQFALTSILIITKHEYTNAHVER